MAIVWLIVAITVALTAALGTLRARSLGPLVLELALLLAAAGACYLIGESKTGGYLSGIIGVLLSLLMLICAAGLTAGAAGRWLWNRLRPGPAKAPPAAHWDLWLIGAVSALAVMFSAME